jgi:Zn finger protein HypA/HybF involved in hydrogenase expression
MRHGRDRYKAALKGWRKKRVMSKKKYTVRAECPACACGDVSFLGPEKLSQKFIGDEKEIEILCPMCGTKHKGKVEEEKE